MVEYIYDAIKASANTEAQIAAVITGDEGEAITEGCSIKLFSDEELLYENKGNYFNETWFFSIPAKVTSKLHGRYWYYIYDDINNKCLNFKQPFYIV